MSVADHDAGTLPAGIEQRSFGFWRRCYAMMVKEFIQLRRDRVSFAMIVMIPVMQLLLFGYAINTTPRNLPTAVLLQEDSDLARSILKAHARTPPISASPGKCTSRGVRRSPAVRHGAVRGGNPARISSARCGAASDPALLVAADATDPVAAGSARVRARNHRADRAGA